MFLIFELGKVEFDTNAIVYRSLTFVLFEGQIAQVNLLFKLPFNFYFSKMNKSLGKKTYFERKQYNYVPVKLLTALTKMPMRKIVA